MNERSVVTASACLQMSSSCHPAQLGRPKGVIRYGILVYSARDAAHSYAPAYSSWLDDTQGALCLLNIYHAQLCLRPCRGVVQVSSVAFTAEDFPVVSGSSTAPHGAMGLWAAFANNATGNSRALMDAEFPALPSLSKAQKKRIKEASRSLVERLSAAAQPPRVVNRAAPSGGAGPSSGSVPGANFADAFPALPSSSSSAGPAPASAPSSAINYGASAAASSRAVDPGPSASAAALLGFTSAPSSSSAAAVAAGGSSGARSQAQTLAPTAAQRPPQMGEQDFPSLGGGVSRRPVVAPSFPTHKSASSQSLSTMLASPSRPTTATASRPAAAAAAAAPPAPAAPPAMDDFPALPAGKPKAKIQLRSPKPVRVFSVLWGMWLRGPPTGVAVVFWALWALPCGGKCFSHAGVSRRVCFSEYDYLSIHLPAQS